MPGPVSLRHVICPSAFLSNAWSRRTLVSSTFNTFARATTEDCGRLNLTASR